MVQTTLFVYGSREYIGSSRLYDGTRIGVDFTASVSGNQNGNNVLELIDSNGNDVDDISVSDPTNVHVVFSGTHYGYYKIAFLNRNTGIWQSNDVQLWSK